MSKIPYDLTKIRGVAFDIDGVLSPSTVTLGDDGIPIRMANLKDGYALRLAVKQGLKLCIISGAFGQGLKERYNMLGIDHVYLAAGRKTETLARWMESEGLSAQQVAYVGDDIPDAECMKAVGLAVAPADAAIDILAIANYISPAKGGYGVARDLLEQILRATDRWPATASASF